MNAEDFEQAVRDALPYSPNAQQAKVIEVLSRFCLAPADGAERAFILNGYAGTGKTSLTGALVRTLERHGMHAVLLAPTGRAAKVFSSNSGGHPAFTIHRKIYRHNPGAPTGDYSFLAPADNRAKDTVFIVDEASMIGGDDGRGNSLLEDLITYVFAGDNCRLILIGDTAQLPPVGSDRSPAMNVEKLRSYGLRVSSATLTETARQAADSGVLFNATRLRKVMIQAAHTPQGETAPIPKLRVGDFEDVHIVENEELPELLEGAYSYGGVDNTILITLSNRRALEFNMGVRSQVLYREEEIARDDRLIVSKNHYFARRVPGLDFVANGDILNVERVYGTETRYGLRFADVTLSIPSPAEPDKIISFEAKIILDNLTDPAAGLTVERLNALYYSIISDNERYGDMPLDRRASAIRTDPYWNALHVKYAYAVTCHKAQGGQWENVFVDLSYIPEDALGLTLYRWLYTAITRSTNNLFLINPPDLLLEK